MKNEEIELILSELHTLSDSLDEFDQKLQLVKDEYVKKGDQQGAKRIWIYQTIIEIHSVYRQAFELLKQKKYYDAWCKLESIEITLSALKKHFLFNKREYFLWHIEKCVRNLQIIFPYRVFLSSEILKKTKICSVCKEVISIRNPCGHVVGEIYDGEMCYRIVTESELLGVSIVQNPGNKYSVAFMKNETTDETIDQYNYSVIDYLFELVTSPYESWNLEVSQREVRKVDYGNADRNDQCPCGSGKKFKKCCLNKIGEKYPHYEFILLNPSNKIVFSNTLKS